MNHATARRKALILPADKRQASVWADITKDPKTGHTVARDLFKAVAFLGALAWGAVMGYLKWRGDKELTAEPMYALLAYSGGLQYIKARQVAATGLDPMGAIEPPPPELPAYATAPTKETSAAKEAAA